MPKHSSYRWVFFDIGNVLMDETPWRAAYPDLFFDLLHAFAPTLTRTEFDAEAWTGGARPGLILAQRILERHVSSPTAQKAARRAFFQGAVDEFYRICDPAPGASALLAKLQTTYRLGSIANQHALVHPWLARHHLADYFEVEAFDCDLGFGKPDPRIFRHALALANCDAQQALMIGDRLDNDVAPAKALGMRTLLFTAFGAQSDLTPTRPEETPHAVANRLTDIPGCVVSIFDG